jgi:DNA-binding MarR family transcriptional regulator
MAKAVPVKRIEGALGALLSRGTRIRLHERLVSEIPGVDATTYPVLSGLARLGPASATRLAEAVGLDRTVTTRYVSRLEKAGLIARTADDADKRATRLELTAAGRAVIATTRKRLALVLEDAVKDWPKREAERFAAALEKFSRAL